jgi:hypothetical protein
MLAGRVVIAIDVQCKNTALNVKIITRIAFLTLPQLLYGSVSLQVPPMRLSWSRNQFTYRVRVLISNSLRIEIDVTPWHD